MLYNNIYFGLVSNGLAKSIIIKDGHFLGYPNIKVLSDHPLLYIFFNL